MDNNKVDRYKREISNSEIEEIAINLTSLMKPLTGGGSYD